MAHREPQSCYPDEVTTKRRRIATMAAFQRITAAVERAHGDCAVVRYRKAQAKRAEEG
jgi:hypothetical protein